MSQMFFLKYLGMSKNPLISTAGGRFHFITAQGRHLFKETTFTVSTLPRAWLWDSSFASLTAGSQGSWDCTIVRPTENLLLFPQDKEGYGSVTPHEENCSLFSRSRRLPFQRG